MVGPAMGRWHIGLHANQHLSGWYIHIYIEEILKTGPTILPKAQGWARMSWNGMTGCAEASHGEEIPSRGAVCLPDLCISLQNNISNGIIAEVGVGGEAQGCPPSL